MDSKVKKFKCEKCGNETYTDKDICVKCNEKKSIKPIPKELYKCFLNGVLYGCGDLSYIHELFRDYVITSKMYGKKECDFKIVKD